MGYIIVITGNQYHKTGVGKSYTAIRIAEQLDPDFRDGTKAMKKIIFTPEDFVEAMKVVDEKKRPGQVIIIDEAGLLINSRQWYSAINKYMSSVVMSFRTTRCLAIFVTPQIGSIDKQIRIFANMWMVAEKFEKGGKIKVKTKVWRLKWDDLDVGKFHLKNIVFWNRETNRREIYNTFWPSLPENKELLDAYEQKSRQFKVRIRQNISESESFNQDEFLEKVMNDPDLWMETTRGRRKVSAEDIELKYMLKPKEARVLARLATKKAMSKIWKDRNADKETGVEIIQ